MASELLMGLGAFKTMFDLAKGLKDINDATTRNAVAIELQEKILSAQVQQATLIERVGELEKQVARFETWDTEKQRYELQELPPGVFVYALKKGMEKGEPPHSLCQPCYENGKKSILQRGEPHNGVTKLHCPSCGNDYKIGHHQWSRVETRRPGGWRGA